MQTFNAPRALFKYLTMIWDLSMVPAPLTPQLCGPNSRDKFSSDVLACPPLLEISLDPFRWTSLAMLAPDELTILGLDLGCLHNEFSVRGRSRSRDLVMLEACLAVTKCWISLLESLPNEVGFLLRLFIGLCRKNSPLSSTPFFSTLVWAATSNAGLRNAALLWTLVGLLATIGIGWK